MPLGTDVLEMHSSPDGMLLAAQERDGLRVFVRSTDDLRVLAEIKGNATSSVRVRWAQ